MKKHARLNLLIFVGIMLAVVGLAAFAIRAEEKPRSSEPKSRTSEKEGSPRGERSPSYSLEIVEGVFTVAGKKQEATLANIADVLRERHPRANIVLAPELGQVHVMDLKLRSEDLAETLEALRIASGNVFTWHKNLEPPGLDPTTGLPSPQPQEVLPSPLYVLSRNVLDSAGNPRRMVEVFNLSGYLEHLGKRDEKDISSSLREIEQIVSDTLVRVQGNVGPADQPSFQFHPGANLFIVIGPPQAIEVTGKVINALPGVAGARGYPDPRAEMQNMQRRTAQDEAFRRRYGLGPPGVSEPGARPGAPPARPPENSPGAVPPGQEPPGR